jgi:hypothetical protein
MRVVHQAPAILEGEALAGKDLRRDVVNRLVRGAWCGTGVQRAF